MFNKSLIPWAVAAIFLILFVVQTCTGPIDDDHVRAVTELETKIKIKDDLILKKNQDLSRLRIRIAQDSSLFQDTITIIEKENVQLERNLARQRAKPEVIRIVRENPVIDTLIQTYDSIISKRDEQIYVQAKYVSQLQGDLSAVEANFREQIALHVQKFENEKLIADEYRDQAKKERRKGRFAKILIPVALVGGFLAGSSL